MARENPRWGDRRIKGELLKLGIKVSATAIRMLLRQHRIPPAPRRSGPTWRQFIRAHASGIIATDLFTIDTVLLQTLYVIVCIELGTRGCSLPTALPIQIQLGSHSRRGMWFMRSRT